MQEQLKSHLEESQFIIPSFDLYNGATGFQDYGLLGNVVKQKLLKLWRDHFLFEDDFYEIEAPTLLLPEILKASGHIDRFFDYVIYDKDNKCHRADHLIKNNLKLLGQNSDVVDTWNHEQMEDYIKNNLSSTLRLDKDTIKLETKNLMYKTDEMYMRPELAQNIFVNFEQYLRFHKNKLPFGVATTGKSYRKEISPQQFIRMREFTQFELEYFFDPNCNNHSKFNTIQNIQIPLLTSKNQLEQLGVEYINIASAVNNNIIKSEIMGYFLARIYLFAQLVGLKNDKIRFRQHLPNEMAHYASECWDLECFVDGNWLECVGCANRQNYDLKAHSSRKCLAMKRNKIIPIMKEFGWQEKIKSSTIINHLNTLTQNDISLIQNELLKNKSILLNVNGEEFTLNKNMVEFEQVCEEFYPHVIEPSFGIDRLMYAIFNQNFWARENDEKRIVLSLPIILSPYDVAILQLCNKEDLLNIVNNIKNLLKKNKILCYVDPSGVAIGKRYARTDKLGIKYAVTVDFDSLNDNCITIRERDSMKQNRISIDELVNIFL